MKMLAAHFHSNVAPKPMPPQVRTPKIEPLKILIQHDFPNIEAINQALAITQLQGLLEDSFCVLIMCE